ncbi:hypothetical protein BU23DRAFT_231792 [Bimuria novae-zelandiae CBS 107.79]|uniref:Heterokaryon incompatibility domain-containing protein n=1 Tax=Bimuria novae-zelandiae CBS 107.79 TaxID=1447943 RepID=A0A6A5UY21_9PLEO|nr:hypothetical protein BU23DRAFT_231792 [Bimuria novae-zelandiae CBS 107.79]
MILRSYTDQYLHQRITALANGRKPMFTRDSWIMCANDVRVRDHVCFIAGATIPFVLRRVDPNRGCRSFILLGECYLNAVGHLSGRAVQEPNPTILWDILKKRIHSGKTYAWCRTASSFGRVE